ncbi:hypothetical protein [Streptomyces tsukubensis]|uniref:hypothetical protein n=1 Tax=Streptomyces tsukubensis TaxID=83656 RepID=UPI00344F135E
MITPYLAPNLSPDKDRNVKSCERAFARLAETAWTPLAGYPGSARGAETAVEPRPPKTA